MNFRPLLVTVLMTLTVCPAFSQRPLPLTAEQRDWVSKAEKHEKNGWIYLHIEGKPRERGFQHAYLLAADIKDALRIAKRVWEYQSAMEWQWLVDKSTSHLLIFGDVCNYTAAN